MKWICLLMFGSVGLTCFIAGLVWGGKRFMLLRGGARTSGVVVDFFVDSSSRSIAYYPLVEFKATTGKTYQFKGSTGSGSPSYEKGATVSVVYNPADPTVAQVADFEQFWLGPLGIGLFGFLFLIAGIGGFIMVADSDATFGPAFQQKMARAELYEGKVGIELSAVVSGIRQKPGKGDPLYIVTCRGGAPGGTQRDFDSDPLSFDPGPKVIGKTVSVYVDPQDPKRYFVLLDPLFKRDY